MSDRRADEPRRGGNAWRRYLRFWGNDPERDLDDELRFHLEARVDEFIAAGLDPARARAEALARLGDLARFKGECVKIDSQWTRERNMLDFLHGFAADIRHAVRQLRRTPSLTIAAILCFALGIGANTAIFSVVDAVLFRPLPFREPNRLVLVGEGLPRFSNENFGVISEGEVSDFQPLDGHVFSASTAYETTAFALTGGGEPERVDGVRATYRLFDVLGVAPVRGRGFAATDTLASSGDVVVLSNALWRSRYQSDASVIGRSIDVDGKPMTVIGVAPPGFQFPLGAEAGQPAQLFALLHFPPDVDRNRASSYGTFFLARLAPGVTLTAARAAVGAVAKAIPARHPQAYSKDWVIVADALPLRDRAVMDVRSPLLILLAAVGLVLLIACINVSSLLIARVAARRREIAVRQALGASRARLVQQFFGESLVLVAAGSALGLSLAVWGARLLSAHAPRNVLERYAPSVDTGVLAVTAAVVVATAMVFSLVPAFAPGRGTLGSALRDESRASTAGRRQRSARHVLVVAEISLALMLAAAAGLMVRSFVHAHGIQPGFDAAHAVTVRVGLPPGRYAGAADLIQFEQRAMERLRRIPGVRAVSATNDAPMGDDAVRFAIGIEGSTSPTTPIGAGEIVYPGYFDAMGMRMRDGRAIDASDVKGALNVVVVNETAAREYFGARGALGRRIKSGGAASPGPWLTIVGIAPDVRESGLDKPVTPEVYFPVLQVDTALVRGLMRTVSYIVRSDADPTSTMNDVRTALRELDPALPLVGLRPLSDVVDVSLGARRFNTVLLGAFAALALVLAAVGIYGVIAYSVVQRTREIGIRLAIGATPRSVRRLVVGQAVRLALVGVTIGIVGALALTRLMRTLLFDVSPLDPIAFVGAALLLFAVAAVASYLPAARASRIDPRAAIAAL